MKNFLLPLLILTSSFGYTQEPNPDLFQTWYLNFVQLSDLGTPYQVSEIEPAITPTLNILEDYAFNGEGACNTFSGVFEFQNPENIETSAFSYTDNNCDTDAHNFFENEYFSFMQSGGFYEITQEGNGLVLTISNPIFGQALFKNFLLNTNEFDLSNINIYPNPSSDFLYIDSRYTLINKIEIVNSTGQLSKKLLSNFNILDISDLSIGLYFIKIYTEDSVSIKKNIKK